jgi:CRISPR-associated RAMP protein (TIGR02581 family)
MLDGKMQPVIPGSSLKGVFRSRAEKYLPDSCNIFDKKNKCFYNSKNLSTGKERYKAVCEACKLFGNLSLKSRVEFSDAFPVEGTVKTGTRYQVTIDRLTGAARKGALFETEVVEKGTFKTEISLRNFSSHQIKVLLLVIQDINEGYVRIGSSTSRGFGRVTAENIAISYRDYSRPGDGIGTFYEKEYDWETCLEKLKTVSLNTSEGVNMDGIPDLE